MPNHLHGIPVITDPVRAQHAAPLPARRTNVQPRALGAIVRSLKSAVTKRINRMRGAPGTPVWLRNYYEHVIRNDAALKRIREYIRHKPARWSEDRLYRIAPRKPSRQL